MLSGRKPHLPRWVLAGPCTGDPKKDPPPAPRKPLPPPARGCTGGGGQDEEVRAHTGQRKEKETHGLETEPAITRSPTF